MVGIINENFEELLKPKTISKYYWIINQYKMIIREVYYGAKEKEH